MPEITVNDFLGGRDTRNHQLLIDANKCASGSYNVWAPNGSLTKSPGVVQLSALNATASPVVSFYYDSVVISTLDTYYRANHRDAPSTNLGGLALFAALGTGGILTSLGYTTGTVSISGASLISATGSGTTWASHVSAGDNFSVSSTGEFIWVKIASVEDNTHLTLSNPVTAAVASGTTYIAAQTLDRTEVTWASLNGFIWSCSLDNVLQQFNGSGVLRVISSPKAAILQVHKNYLFAARTNTAESRLYWSAIKDPTSWPTNNFIDIDKNVGKISGLFSYGNELIIFKNFGIYKLIGEIFDSSNPSYSVVPIITPKSFFFNGNNSIAIYKGQLIFLALDGIYVYRHGTNSIEKISLFWERTSIPNILEDVSSFTGVDQRIYAVSFQNNYIIRGIRGPSLYSGSYQNSAGILDNRGAWWAVEVDDSAYADRIFGRTPMMIQPDKNGVTRILILFNEAQSKILEWDFNDPRGTNSLAVKTLAINSRWVSKEFNIDFGWFDKLIIYLEKQTAGNLTVEHSIDQGSFISNTVSMTTGKGNLIRTVLDINQKGSTIQVRFSNNVVNQNFNIFGFKIKYEKQEESYRR